MRDPEDVGGFAGCEVSLTVARGRRSVVLRDYKFIIMTYKSCLRGKTVKVWSVPLPLFPIHLSVGGFHKSLSTSFIFSRCILGFVLFGTVLLGIVLLGIFLFGIVLLGIVLFGIVLLGIVLFGIVLLGKVLFGFVLSVFVC
jgi:hypothetical protein